MKEEAPSLKLQILQGPRKGETIEFRPESAIRIGRVIRGNTLPIKDPGISTKHLSILFESNKWVLRDLDSSNGTVLDETNIPPNTPFDLHDGSTIKIGELTSILISFLQQNPNRNGSFNMVKPGLQEIHENDSVNGGDESSVLDRPVPKRVTRNSKNTRNAIRVTDAANLDVPEEKVEEEPKKNTRVTRNLKSKKNVVKVCDSNVGNLNALEEKVEEEPTKKNTRVTRNLKSKKNVVEVCESNVGNLDALEQRVEEEPKKNTRVTRNSKNKGSVIGENSNLDHGVENVEKKKTRGGAKGRRKLPEVCVGDDDDDVVGDGGCKETSGEREKGNLNGDDNEPDLEKMTLGEWFDFLEAHLPKQIIDATEEMFDSMREKAERLREYIIMQENNKAQVPPK